MKSNGVPSSPHEDLEPAIKALGTEIFERMGEAQPSAFNKRGLSGRLMEWSMKRPSLKVNMFRLVDVLPTLTSSHSVATHAAEYLREPLGEIHSFLKLGLPRKPDFLRARLTSAAVRFSVYEMAKQFIAGEAPHDALKALRRIRRTGLAFTVDLLGEFCVSEKEAAHYLARYMEALDVFAQEVPRWSESAPLIESHPGELSPVCISVKLSALYSQCSPLNFERSVEVLSERLAIIARQVKQHGALLYVDAEDTSNNSIIYTVFKEVFGSSEFRDLAYPGIVLQAYGRESPRILEDLIAFAKRRGAPIAVRLVKGAYWDHETILSDQNFWPSPLFRLKESTDANYEALSRMLIDHAMYCLPAFGSHNIRSLAHACCYARTKGLTERQFELQMLYGMAEPIAAAFQQKGYLVRLYVPLGEILPGMGYLVRRLLENTSNESFLRHTFYDESEVERLLDRPQPGK